MTRDDTDIKFSIDRSITYEESKDNRVGKGAMYATADNEGKGPTI